MWSNQSQIFVKKKLYTKHENEWLKRPDMTTNLKKMKSSWEVPAQSKDKSNDDNDINVTQS
jgi:hypothetical protein